MVTLMLYVDEMTFGHRRARREIISLEMNHPFTKIV